MFADVKVTTTLFCPTQELLKVYMHVLVHILSFTMCILQNKLAELNTNHLTDVRNSITNNTNTESDFKSVHSFFHYLLTIGRCSGMQVMKRIPLWISLFAMLILLHYFMSMQWRVCQGMFIQIVPNLASLLQAHIHQEVEQGLGECIVSFAYVGYWKLRTY